MIYKKVNLKNIPRNTNISFLKDNYDSLIFKENTLPNGKKNIEITLKNNASFPTRTVTERGQGFFASSREVRQPILQADSQTFNYTNFETKGFYEAIRQVPKEENIEDYLKASFKIEYNFLDKNFEGISLDLPEDRLPFFYDELQIYAKTPELFLNGGRQSKGNIFVGNTVGQAGFVNLNLFDRNFFDDRIKLQQPTANFIRELNPKKELFPFYTTIKFNNVVQQDFSFEVNLNQIGAIQSARAQRNITFTNTFNKFGLFSDFFIFLSAQRQQIPALVYNIDGEEKRINTQINEIKSWLSDYATRQPDIFSFINAIEARNKVNFQDILFDKKTYSEIIGYKVAKFDTFGPAPTPIQEFYFPNIGEYTEFIDTQIKYGKRYNYKFYTITLNLAYKFKCVQSTEQKLVYEYEPTAFCYIIDADTQYDNYLLDSPPLEPEVEFLPLIGESNKIKINLNTSIGTRSLFPITLEEAEETNFSRLRSSQDKKQGEKILFQSDEPSEFFEIYRLEAAPETYQDFFKSQFKQVVSTNQSSAASFIDNLSQNKKYYYMFRSIDYHANLSNPSTIYTVEIINDNTSVYPVTGIFTIGNKEALKDPDRSFRRFISFTPAVAHKIYNEEETENLQQLANKDEILQKIPIGALKPAVWNKNFKVRIISKSTGKKLDMNVVFDIKRERN